MLTIRTATDADLDAIWPMVQRAVTHMNALGNPQWGEDYPTRQYYADDIHRGQLYLALQDGVPAGVVCINTEQALEYAPLPWTTAPTAVVIHRMVVEPRLQRCHVATALLDHAEALARCWNITAMRLDTYSRNDRMQSLLLSRGFRRVGYVHFRNRPLPFPCFEKSL